MSTTTTVVVTLEDPSSSYDVMLEPATSAIEMHMGDEDESATRSVGFEAFFPDTTPGTSSRPRRSRVMSGGGHLTTVAHLERVKDGKGPRKAKVSKGKNFCGACHGKYGQTSQAEWVQCSECDTWQHASCGGKMTARYFFCATCVKSLN